MVAWCVCKSLVATPKYPPSPSGVPGGLLGGWACTLSHEAAAILGRSMCVLAWQDCGQFDALFRLLAWVCCGRVFTNTQQSTHRATQCNTHTRHVLHTPLPHLHTCAHPALQSNNDPVWLGLALMLQKHTNSSLADWRSSALVGGDSTLHSDATYPSLFMHVYARHLAFVRYAATYIRYTS